MVTRMSVSGSELARLLGAWQRPGPGYAEPDISARPLPGRRVGTGFIYRREDLGWDHLTYTLDRWTGIGTPEIAEVVMRRVLAAEYRTCFGHQTLDIGVPDTRAHRTYIGATRHRALAVRHRPRR